jgi:membrane protease YdiL (CAAX protease family)
MLFIAVTMGTTNQTATNAAFVYSFMLVVWGILLHVEFLKDSDLDIVNLGRKWEVALFVGGVLAVLFSTSFSFVTIPQGTFSFSNKLIQAYFVLAAGFIEANFFRGLMLPALIQLFHDRTHLISDRFSAGMAANVIQALVFGAFHIAVRGSNIAGLWVTVIFGFVAGLGVYYFRSIAFEYGLHFTNNLIYVLYVLQPFGFGVAGG